VILIDTNLLLYAYDTTSVHHVVARDWLEQQISSGEAVRFSWFTILAFLRITTNFRAMLSPLTEEEACGIITELLTQPAVAVLSPGPRHWDILNRVIQQSGCRGALVMDAELAALAIEYGAILCTHDRDFARFPTLRLEYPLA